MLWVGQISAKPVNSQHNVIMRIIAPGRDRFSNLSLCHLV